MHRFLPLLIIVIVILATYFYLPFRREVAYKLHISGDPTASCCSEQEILSSTGEFDENATAAIFNNSLIDYPKTSLAQANLQQSVVLGESTGEEKRIEVSLKEQKLRAFEGGKLVMEFPISSGKWSPTPTGDFSIWSKTRNQSMIGGSKELGTYYNLPNVPNNMFFYQGFAIHGAYWHNNFGQAMSHGCINAPLAQVAQLFEWAGPKLAAGQNAARATADNPGTKVRVF